MKSNFRIRETQMFQLNMTFEHRQRNQIRLTQTVLIDETTHKYVFLLAVMLAVTYVQTSGQMDFKIKPQSSTST